MKKIERKEITSEEHKAFAEGAASYRWVSVALLVLAFIVWYVAGQFSSGGITNTFSKVLACIFLLLSVASFFLARLGKKNSLQKNDPEN